MKGQILGWYSSAHTSVTVIRVTLGLQWCKWMHFLCKQMSLLVKIGACSRCCPAKACRVVLVYVCKGLDLDFQTWSIFRWGWWTFLLAMLENISSHTTLIVFPSFRIKRIHKNGDKKPTEWYFVCCSTITRWIGWDQQREGGGLYDHEWIKGFHKVLFIKTTPSMEKKQVQKSLQRRRHLLKGDVEKQMASAPGNRSAEP